MAKIFEFNGNKGSLIDQVSKTAGTLTSGAGGFKKTEKGLAMEFDGATTSLTYPDSDILDGMTKLSIVAWIKPIQGGHAFHHIITKNYTNGYSFQYRNQDNAIFAYINSIPLIAPKNSIEYGKWQMFIFTYDSAGAGTGRIYKNNTLIVENTAYVGATVGANSSDLTISPSGNPLYGSVGKIQMFNTSLTQSERNTLYQEFLNASPTEKPVRGFELVKPTDLSHERNTHFTGDEYTQVMEFTDNASNSSTLRLNDGRDFAVVDWTGNSDFQEIGTSSETESPVIPSTVKIFAKNGVLTYFKSTNNNFSFDIANLPSDLTHYENSGSNTTTGNIANLPSGLVYYYNRGSNTTTGDIANLPSDLTHYISGGSNTTTGDIANLPSKLTYYNNTGNNTTTGNIANLPSGLTYYENQGSNTTTGDIANLPAGLTVYRNYGYNTTTGDIANLPSDLTHYENGGYNTTTGNITNLPSKLTYYDNTGNNQVNTYTAGRVWANNMRYFKHLPAAGYGLSSTDVDNLLIDLANVTTWTSSKAIDLSGNNAAPGPLGKAAIDTLRNVKGVTVTVTGGY